MLTVRLLGGFEVQIAGTRVDIPSRAAQALLAYLLLPPGKAHRRGRLAGLLWPDAPELNAQRNLRQALWQLGRALEPAGARLVVADRLQVVVDTRLLQGVDVALLEDPLRPEASLEVMAARAGVYAGDLLPGFYDEWVVVERERLEALFERLMIRLLAKLETEQAWPLVLEWGHRWIGLGHVPEAAYQAVMRAYGALGQTTSAIQAYQRCRDALQTQLGLEPSPMSQALYLDLVRDHGLAEPVTVPTGRAPAGRATGTTLEVDAAESPYKGLHFFGEADAHRFFGRERLVGKLLGYLHTANFLAVVGASGSGKSSLVRAGLVPALRGAVAWPEGVAPLPASTHWPVHIFSPGTHPLESLAASLAGAEGGAGLAAELRADPGTLERLARERPASLLVVDQFEELFTQCADEGARRAFIANLLQATAPEPAGGLRVVITLRADFYAHCASYAALRLALERHQQFIGPMNAAELRQCIELPAQRAGLSFQSGLVELILRDVGDEPGALPLLSHALLETWRRRREGQLGLSAYAEAGGVHGAIARTAEHVYQALPPAHQTLARRIFLQLTEPGEGNEATRRRVALSDLLAFAGPTAAVLHELAEARLITIGAEAVEVAHEALIRAWPALQQWLAEDRDGLRLQRRLAEAAQTWAALDHSPDELYRGGRLAQAHEWAQAHPELLSVLEAEFLRAAEAHAEQTAAERAAQVERELEAAQRLAEAEKASAVQARRAASQSRFLAGVLSLLVVVVFALAVVAQVNLTRSEAQRLAAEADALLQAGGDAQLIGLLAIQSLNRQYSPAADAVLGKALSLNYPSQRLVGHLNSLRDAAYSPNGKFIVTVANDLTGRLWETATGQEVRRFLGHTGPVTSVDYSQDGRWVLTGSEDGTARLWDVETGESVRSLVGHSGQIQSVALSVDGQWAVTAGTDDTVRVWRLATGEQVGKRLPVGAEAAALSPDGRWVLTGNREGLAEIWDWAAGTVVRRLEGHSGRLIAVSFSADGKLAVTGGVDKTARVWDTATGRTVAVLVGHTASVFGVAFSPDGSQVVTAGEDRNARLWEAATGRELGQFYGHSATITEVAFAPDGQHFVTAGSEGLALVWAIQPAGPVHQLAGHSAQVWNVVFSPDGRYLATASVDKTARLWDAQTGALVRTFKGHTGEIWGLAYSPDGRWLATGSFDGTARLWDTGSGAEVRRFTTAAGEVIAGVAFSPDGRYLTAGDEAGVAYIWEAATGTLLTELRGHASGLNLLAYSPNGQVIATPSNDSTARLWSASTGALLHELKGHAGFVSAVAFSPDGRLVATSSSDSTVRIWDAATGTLVRTLTGHSELVWSVAFAPDGRFLATASADGTARLWNAESGLELRRFAGHTAGVQGVAVAPDGRLVATASDDGTVRLWDLDYHATVALLCARLLRDLTPEEREQHGVAGQAATCGGD